MLSAHSASLLLGLLVVLVLGFAFWGFWRYRRQAGVGLLVDPRTDLLVGLAILAAFAFGVFLAYLLAVF